MLRSINWALLVGIIGGALYGGLHAYLLKATPFWITLAVLIGLPVGVVASGDLLIPAPEPIIHPHSERGNRVGPFRWAMVMLFIMAEGIYFGCYLWGTVSLVCERRTSEAVSIVDCRRINTGWFNTQQTGITLYENVTDVGMDVHNEMMLQHGPYQQSMSVSGFAAEDMDRVQAFLASQQPILTLLSKDWIIRVGPLVCLSIALLTGIWAFFSLRQGLHLLRQQLDLGEIDWGWSR